MKGAQEFLSYPKTFWAATVTQAQVFQTPQGLGTAGFEALGI